MAAQMCRNQHYIISLKNSQNKFLLTKNVKQKHIILQGYIQFPRINIFNLHTILNLNKINKNNLEGKVPVGVTIDWGATKEAYM